MERRRLCSCKKPGCRPARPLCGTQRKKTLKYQSCACSAYHYPHRRGSGRCDHHPEAHRRQWEQFTGQSWDVGGCPSSYRLAM